MILYDDEILIKHQLLYATETRLTLFPSRASLYVSPKKFIIFIENIEI